MDNFYWEVEVLGGLIQLEDPSNKSFASVMAKLTEGCFTHSDTIKLYRGIKQAVSKNLPVNPLTVDDNSELELSRICEITRDVFSTANIHTAVKKIVESSIQRFAQSKMQEAIMAMSNTEKPIEDRVNEASAVFSEVSARMQNRESRLKKISDYMAISLNETYDRLEGKIPAGYKTQYDNLNEMFEPKYIPQGSLFVVGGLPKMGKTKLVTGMVNGFARMYNEEQGIIYSLEMMGEQMAERAMCEDARVDSGAFWRPTGPDDKEAAKLGNTIAYMRERDVYISDAAGVTIEQIETECRQLARVKKVGIIAVDYLTLMEAPKADRNDLAFGNITKRLKSLAKELKCVVLLLTQLSRDVAKRAGDKRPMPQDSRDTGQIEQDCDFWMGVHKESVFDENASPELVELIVRYNRHGKTGTVYMKDCGAYLLPAEPKDFLKSNKDNSNDFGI